MTEQVREALAATGASLYRIHKETGVQRITARRFLGGEGINSKALDKLAAWLGLEARPIRTAAKPAKPSKRQSKG